MLTTSMQKPGRQIFWNWTKVKGYSFRRSSASNPVPLSRAAIHKVRIARRRIAQGYYVEDNCINTTVDRIIEANPCS